MQHHHHHPRMPVVGKMLADLRTGYTLCVQRILCKVPIKMTPLDLLYTVHLIRIFLGTDQKKQNIVK